MAGNTRANLSRTVARLSRQRREMFLMKKKALREVDRLELTNLESKHLFRKEIITGLDNHYNKTVNIKNLSRKQKVAVERIRDIIGKLKKTKSDYMKFNLMTELRELEKKFRL